MATFQEIADKISTEINQGTTLDAIILEKVYEAHRFMENNNNFKYMEAERTFVQAAAALTFTLSTGTKRVEMLRYDYEGNYKYLWNIHPTDPLYAETAPPSYWYMVGATGGKLWTAFEETTTITCIEVIRTQTWAPTDEDWMTQQGQDALKFLALAAMAGPARDPDLATLYAPDVQKSLATVLALDDELRRSMQSEEMRFS